MSEHVFTILVSYLVCWYVYAVLHIYDTCTKKYIPISMLAIPAVIMIVLISKHVGFFGGLND